MLRHECEPPVAMNIGNIGEAWQLQHWARVQWSWGSHARGLQLKTQAIESRNAPCAARHDQKQGTQEEHTIFDLQKTQVPVP